jgi:hypothetical protein
MSIQPGDIVESPFIYGKPQREERRFGFSPIQLSGEPAIYHPGDVVYLPYAAGEVSSMEAVGLAWSAAQQASGSGVPISGL